MYTRCLHTNLIHDLHCLSSFQILKLPSLFCRRTDSLKGPENSSDSLSAISNGDLEALKQEILVEMRKEINKMKQEILEGKIYQS